MQDTRLQLNCSPYALFQGGGEIGEQEELHRSHIGGIYTSTPPPIVSYMLAI